MTPNNKEWKRDFRDEFGIHFKNSSGELQFVLSFIDELLSQQRKEWITKLENMLDDGRPLGDLIKKELK